MRIRCWLIIRHLASAPHACMTCIIQVVQDSSHATDSATSLLTPHTLPLNAILILCRHTSYTSSSCLAKAAHYQREYWPKLASMWILYWIRPRRPGEVVRAVWTRALSSMAFRLSILRFEYQSICSIASVAACFGVINAG